MSDLRRGRKKVKGASHKRCLSPFSSLRRGVTLVELLVVIGIMLILATIALPAMRPLTEARRIREPARAINVYFGRARSRAIESGRPCGVMFERLERQPQASVILRQVEVPPPYSGESFDAVVQLQDWTYTDDPSWSYWLVEGEQPVRVYWEYGPRVLKVRVRDRDFSPGLIRRGDLMRLNDQGPWYRIGFDDNVVNSTLPADFTPFASGLDWEDFPVETDPAEPDYSYINFLDPPGKTTVTDALGFDWITSHVLTLTLDAKSNYRSPFPERRTSPAPSLALSGTVKFQIARQPVPSAGAPLELSRGVVIDLGGSGTDRSSDLFAPLAAQDSLPVIVLFAPHGGVDRVVVGGVQSRVIDPIHLLVGTWEHVPAAPVLRGADTRPVSGGPRVPNPDVDDGLYNWEDQRNLWVALNPQTGLVTVAELNADEPDPSGLSNNYVPSGWDKWGQVVTARKFAREAQVSKGGR